MHILWREAIFSQPVFLYHPPALLCFASLAAIYTRLKRKCSKCKMPPTLHGWKLLQIMGKAVKGSGYGGEISPVYS